MNILKSKNFSEAGRCLGFDYYNATVKNKVIEYFISNGLDYEQIFNQNKKNQYCLYCGKPIKSRNKFCNSSCAAKYNNSHRTLSSETKLKIKESHSKRRLNKTKICKTKICQICGKEFQPQILKNDRVSCASVCSDECRHQLKVQKSNRIY